MGDVRISIRAAAVTVADRRQLGHVREEEQDPLPTKLNVVAVIAMGDLSLK